MIKTLDTKKIRQSICKLRTHRDVKAREVATYLNIKEQSYTKYERVETPSTIGLISVRSFMGRVMP